MYVCMYVCIYIYIYIYMYVLGFRAGGVHCLQTLIVCPFTRSQFGPRDEEDPRSGPQALNARFAT